MKMVERLFDLRKYMGEEFLVFGRSVKDALDDAGLDRVGPVSYPKTHTSGCFVGQQIDDIYESQGEGGLILSLYESERNVMRHGSVEKVDGIIIYIGATGSLIRRVNDALMKRK